MLAELASSVIFYRRFIRSQKMKKGVPFISPPEFTEEISPIRKKKSAQNWLNQQKNFSKTEPDSIKNQTLSSVLRR